jgi:putative transposase
VKTALIGRCCCSHCQPRPTLSVTARKACSRLTVVQRCRFHVWLNTRAKLTLRPTSLAGQELLDLSRQLLHVRTRRQARHWNRKHASYVTARTVKDDPEPRTRSWRYTHARLRSAYYQLNKQTEDLLCSSFRPDPELPSTTNHLEGGINSPIRTKLKLHRGMTNEHQMVLVDWYLYGRTEGAKPPRFCL